MQRRRYFKILLLAVLCVSLLQLVSWLPLAGHAPTASAHAFVIGSDPIDGSTIQKAPSLVRIYFDAPIAAASRASVYAFPPGAPASGQLVNAGQSVINPSNSRELDTPLLPANKLPQGGYEVRWTALSLTDGHTTSGLIGFNLGSSSLGVAGTPTLGPSTSNSFPKLDLQGVLIVAWDWLVLLALLFWIGILLTDYFILPRSASPAFLAQARKHSRSLQILYLLALLVGETINLILRVTTFTQALSGGGVSLNTLAQFALNTTYGHLWLARMILLLIALLFLWSGGKSRQPARNTSLANRAGKRFSQLRQQARSESAQHTPATSLAALPAFMRSQARVSGAVASVSPSRGSSSLSKITTDLALTETPAQEPSIWQITGWLILVGLILLTLALSNEILNLAPLPVSAGILSWISLAAQAAWFGPLAYLGLTLLPILPTTDPDRHAEALVATLKRATPWLLAAPCALLVSEIFLGEATIQTPAQLLSDPYGRALLVRALLLLLTLILTVYIVFFLQPSLQRQTVLLPVVDAEMPAKRARKFALEKTERMVKRSLDTLAGLAAVTLICVALMNFFAPPVVFPNVDYQALIDQQAANNPPLAPASQTQRAGDLSVTLQVQPARVGVANTITLALADAQGKAVNDATVKLSINMEIMDMGETKVTTQRGSSGYSATLAAGQTFSMAGAWVIQVEIDRLQQPAVRATFQVIVT